MQTCRFTHSEVIYKCHHYIQVYEHFGGMCINLGGDKNPRFISSTLFTYMISLLENRQIITFKIQ